MHYLFLAFPLLANLAFGSLPPLFKRQDPIAELQARYQTADVATSGSYNILNCDANNDAVEENVNRARILQKVLPLIHAQVQRLLYELKLGTRSPYGFEPLFKTWRNKKLVRSIFSKIRDEEPVKLSPERARASGQKTAHPTFACLNQGHAATASFLKYCVHGPLMTFGGHELIYICPSFFHLPPGLRPDECPKLADNKLPGDKLAESMYSALIHELVHMYYPKTAGDPKTPERNEVYDLQECIDLDSKRSMLNAQNYAYFAAGQHQQTLTLGFMMLTFVCLAVQARCTAWPTKTEKDKDLL